jgi:sporadic carbohydrate cluster protein (TIGR04323 family)
MVYFYNTPRKCGPYKIPLPIQNAYLRDYANREGVVFSLPVTEYIFDNVWSGLVGIVKKAKHGDTVIMFSICAIIDIFTRVEVPAEVRKSISQSNIGFIFILEKLTVHSTDLESVANVFVEHNGHRLS